MGDKFIDDTHKMTASLLHHCHKIIHIIFYLYFPLIILSGLPAGFQEDLKNANKA